MPDIPTTQILATLPSELFAEVIDHLVLTIGIYKAFRLRVVNKLFNAAILHAIFDGKLIDFHDPVHKRATALSAPLMARRLLALATAKRKRNDSPLLMAIRTACKLCEEDDLAVTSRQHKPEEVYARDDYDNPTCALLCDAVARYMKPLELHNSLNEEIPVSLDSMENPQLSLSAAIVCGNIALVRKLLSMGVDPNATQPFFGKPIMLAAAYGRCEILQSLLDNGANLVPYHEIQQAPRSLGAPTGDYYSIGSNVLRAACLAGHADIVQLLLQHRVPTSGVAYQTSVLAATRGGHASLVKFLLEKASLLPPPSPPPRLLELIFFDASYHGHIEIMKLMLNCGIDVNAERKCGHSYTRAIHLAAIHGHDKAIRFLLEHGAERDHTKNFAGSPISIAIVNGHEEAVQALLDHGADINGTSIKRNRNRSLRIAAHHGQAHMLQFLLRKGADISILGGTGNEVTSGAAAMRAAVEHGHLPAVRVLVEAGIGFNFSSTKTRNVPIPQAARLEHEHLVRVLEDRRMQVPDRIRESNIAGDGFPEFATRWTCEWVGKY